MSRSYPLTISRRERRKNETRRRLVTAAVELFLEKGYRTTTISEICEKADLARGTFFNYFSTKEEILSAESDKQVERCQTAIIRAKKAGASPSAQVSAGLFAMVQGALMETQLAVLRAAAAELGTYSELDSSRQKQVATLIADTIRGGMDSGHFIKDLDADLVGHLFMQTYLFEWRRWTRAPAENNFKASLQDGLEILLRGIEGDNAVV